MENIAFLVGYKIITFAIYNYHKYIIKCLSSDLGSSSKI